MPAGAELDGIHEKAQRYFEKFERSGIKMAGGRNDQMIEIIRAVNQNEQISQTQMLENFGISPIWYERYEEVPVILQSILRR